MSRLVPPVAREKVLQWYPMAEGYGDVVGYGGGELHGPSWVEGDWMGGYALDGDGVDDYVLTTDWGEFVPEIIPGSYGFAVTIQTTSDSGKVIGYNSDIDDLLFYLPEIRDGKIRTWMRGTATEDRGQQGIETVDDTFGDGGTYRIVYRQTQPRDGHTELWVNGQRAETQSHLSDDFAEPFDRTPEESIGMFAINGQNGTSSFFTGIIDDYILYGDWLTESEIQADYQRQPWS